MKTLYIECRMGAAGDMLLGALLELIPEPERFIADMNAWGLPGVEVTAAKAQRCGITGTHVSVTVGGQEEESHDHSHEGHGEHSHHHGHSYSHEGHSHEEHGHDHGHHHHDGHHGVHMADIERTVAALPLPVGVRADVLAVYHLLAQAEAKSHGCAVDKVHFSEVGMMDAIADIAGVCALMGQLAPARVVVSPISVGGGQVKTSHGILPVPAPATAELLQGVPSVGGPVEAELCTPTGAALLRHFASSFGPQPAMAVTGVGYGLGKKEFAAANCVRAFWGDDGDGAAEDEVLEISCNLDDMTGEDIGFALELLLERGALDAFCLPAQMKKSRPGQVLVCLCRPQQEEEMTQLLLRHTTTFGVRVGQKRRHTLARRFEERQTPWGNVRVKAGEGFGAQKEKPEYDDLARVARAEGIPIREIRRELDKG